MKAAFYCLAFFVVAFCFALYMCGCSLISINGMEVVNMSAQCGPTSGTLTSSYNGDRYKQRHHQLAVSPKGATMSSDSNSSSTVTGITNWEAAGLGALTTIILKWTVLP